MRRYGIPIPDRTEEPQPVLPSSAPHPIFERMVSEVLPHTIVDIGTCQGGSAIHFATISSAHVITVDKWDTQAGIECRDKFLREAGARKLGEQITALHMPSLAAAHLAFYTRLKPDLVYIDGRHDEKSVRLDIEAWLPLIPPGGILFGHDFNKGGVADAVKDRLGTVETEGVFWIWRVV